MSDPKEHPPRSATPPAAATSASAPKSQSAPSTPARDPGESGSGESGGSRSGSSSDTMLGKLIVDRGLATQAEVDAVFAAMRTPAGAARAFTDILIEGQIVTRRQLARLRSEAESDRSVLRIPGYQMVRRLGAGAMAAVYLARQTSLDRLVAIKILPRRYSSDPTFVERFYKEGRAAAKLSDPNIVGALDVGSVGEQHYFVMEYVDGETVHDLITKSKRLSERDALTITRQIASALKHAHAKGFIHRDIKPKNIIMTKSGSAKLADLGLARAIDDKKAAEAERHKAFGTPYYISPEQVRGAVDLGPPADIYGLGATLYHMLTGRVPFKGNGPSEVMRAHLSEELVPPDQLVGGLSQHTAEIVELMMRKRPAERYQSAVELMEDLDLALAGQPLRYATRAVDLADIASDVESQAQTTIQAAATSGRLPQWAVLLIVVLSVVCLALLVLIILK
ncbi:MAG: serine/threonine protein kinase [Planctomycetes bacterium]|nr:serine/threonine protein kinase [Planctomycetota bacterium]